jgi:23S rRNA pseudouridine2605 synthase
MSGGAADGKQGSGEAKGERIAKVIARAGICSRRDAERLITEGRVLLNGRKLDTPAITVGPRDRIEVNGTPLATRERTRLWLFHKPKGLVTTNRDPEGRPTVFSALPADMPRVLSVGRLDINTEGLLLLTNDGGLARVLELPSTGWLRRYRVRAHGRVEQPALDALRRGVTIEGMIYGAVEAEIERLQGTNIWLQVGLREGKNREVKRILEHLGLGVNRLIRISYGPFQLGDLEPGEAREVRGRVLRDQLGDKLANAAGADFEAPIRSPEPADDAPRPKTLRAKATRVRGETESQGAKPAQTVARQQCSRRAPAVPAQSAPRRCARALRPIISRASRRARSRPAKTHQAPPQANPQRPPRQHPKQQCGSSAVALGAAPSPVHARRRSARPATGCANPSSTSSTTATDCRSRVRASSTSSPAPARSGWRQSRAAPASRSSSRRACKAAASSAATSRLWA